MKKRVWALLLALVLLVSDRGLINVLAADAEEQTEGMIQTSYYDPLNQCVQSVEATIVETSTKELTSGWYVVRDNITIPDRLTVEGEVHLILTDGCMLTDNRGITVNVGNALTIWGQESGTGTLHVDLAKDNGFRNAGIGGMGGASGLITINGGTIWTRGGNHSAGIGGGFEGSAGDITITGGVVKAEGGAGSADIGCGRNCFAPGDSSVTIGPDATYVNDGKIEAGSVTNNGTLVNHGNIAGNVTNDGTLTGDGSISPVTPDGNENRDNNRNQNTDESNQNTDKEESKEIEIADSQPKNKAKTSGKTAAPASGVEEDEELPDWNNEETETPENTDEKLIVRAQMKDGRIVLADDASVQTAETEQGSGQAWLAVGTEELAATDAVTITVGSGNITVRVLHERYPYAAGLADAVSVVNAVLTEEQIQRVYDGEEMQLRVSMTECSCAIKKRANENKS